jgi:hypothetical protein
MTSIIRHALLSRYARAAWLALLLTASYEAILRTGLVG